MNESDNKETRKQKKSTNLHITRRTMNKKPKTERATSKTEQTEIVVLKRRQRCGKMKKKSIMDVVGCENFSAIHAAGLPVIKKRNCMFKNG